MNPMKLLKLTAGLLTGFGCAAPAFAQVTFSVDMDTLTPGIQSTRSALGPFTAGLVMSVGTNGVSSYGVSAFLDTTELTLTAGTSANTAPLPAGMFSFAAPVEASPFVYSFNGATLGLGPSSTSFTIGTFSYTVTAIVDDGLPDITPGFYNAGIDGLFDNAGLPVVPVFFLVSWCRSRALGRFCLVAWQRRGWLGVAGVANPAPV